MMQLEGKRCLVTGGSRNLGRAICLSLAKEGAKVAFTYRKNDVDAKETARLIEEHAPPALVFRGDVSDARHAREVVDGVVDAWGGLDILINNAGMTQLLPFALIEEADWKLVCDVNVKGVFLFCREAVKHMVHAGTGKIVNITTFGEGRSVDAPVHFAASKAAVRGFTEAFAREMGHHGITANCLAPGLTDGGLSARLPESRRRDYVKNSAMRRLGALEEMAKIVLWMVSDDQGFMTGATIVADGGL